MRGVVLQAVQTGTQQAKCLVKIVITSRARITTAHLNRTTKDTANKLGGSINSLVLGGNVALQPGAGVDGEFLTLIDGTTKTTVVASSIITFRISFRVIDMFGGLIATQSLGCDFEFAGTIASKISNCPAIADCNLIELKGIRR